MARVTRLVAFAIALTPIPARAAPQVTGGVLGGVCGVSDDGGFWEHTRGCFGLRVDATFTRERERDWGFGASLSMNSAAFDDLWLAPGVVLHMPLEPMPIVAALGPGLVLRNRAWSPGVAASLVWGPRSYNFHGAYAAGWGVLVQAEQSFGEHGSNLLWIGLELDAMWLSLPFVALAGWLRSDGD